MPTVIRTAVTIALLGAALAAQDAAIRFERRCGRQFGVKLTPQRRPVDVLMIETIERPTPD